MCINSANVEAVSKMMAPHNSAEVRRLLGMTSYCSRFIPHHAHTVESLRQLTYGQSEFERTGTPQTALDRVKKKLGATGTLAYYDHTMKTQDITDAAQTVLLESLFNRRLSGNSALS